MIKLLAKNGHATAFLFGFSHENLRRMKEGDPIFFDFGYANRADLFGLVSYCHNFGSPQDIAQNIDELKQYCIPFFNSDRGVTPDTLKFFPISKSIMEKFESIPFWGFETNVSIKHPGDSQLWFAGPTEDDIVRYFENADLITQKTQRTYKGFGKR